MDEEKVEALSRNELRSYVVDHRRVGRRTGTTPHFARWKAEGRIKSLLQRTKTVAVAESLPDKANGVASGFALLAVGGYRNLWQVSQADLADLLAVKGIGPARLKFVESYLSSKGVQLNWTVQ